MDECDKRLTNTFLCERTATSSTHFDFENNRLPVVLWTGNTTHMSCPSKHFTLTFLACDVKTACWAGQTVSSSSCGAPVTPLPPSFVCKYNAERVPYTLVCDHRSDCEDKSDEDFCTFPSCYTYGEFQCRNKQCVVMTHVCDEIQHCLDGSDERDCTVKKPTEKPEEIPRPPVIINFHKNGVYYVKSKSMSDIQHNTSRAYVCPETHFLCPGHFTYCMPIFVRCNGVFDCPGREDEKECEKYVCAGFYRCRASFVCVHYRHVCDGMFQCPQRDDELLCVFSCPQNCLCHGLAFFCPSAFLFNDFPWLRFLNGHGSGITPQDLENNTMMIFLSLTDCRLDYLSLRGFPNLRTLDVGRNRLRTIEIDDIEFVTSLKDLSLAGNPLTSLFAMSHNVGLRFASVHFLDVSKVYLDILNITTLSLFPKLSFLNLSGCGVQEIIGEGLPSLKFLDLRKCPMQTFHANVLRKFPTLTKVWADNYKLCCPAVLPPDFQLSNCYAPSDEISSCDALLRSNFYRISLAVFSVLALLGNMVSFVYRVFVKKVPTNRGFSVFVTHLCVSDFLMGVYLALIGIADRLFQGTYLWNDKLWKNSVPCTAAGFLSLLSCEVSAFIMCFITVDRFLVLRFPFSRLHFRKTSAHVTCGLAWLAGIILAGIPVLPSYSHWGYYSQTGICIPLPINRIDFTGHSYSFSVTIILNFVLFLFIAMGQASIYWSVRINAMTSTDSTRKTNDLTVARRLITIAVSDFLCWFPIGLLGLVAAHDVPIPGELSVAAAVIILPVNSAINPFLYTINILLESRRLARERRLQKQGAGKVTENAACKCDGASCSREQALKWIKIWVTEGLLPSKYLEQGLLAERN